MIMEFEVTRMTCERVFNIGNYQSIRLSIEADVASVKNHQEVKEMYGKLLNELETSYNELMMERQQQAHQAQPHTVIVRKY